MRMKYLVVTLMLLDMVNAIAASDSACVMPAKAPDTTAGQAAFDQYSWDMFVALNWPASETQRGEPDCKKTPASDGIKVWQTYKNPDQVFLENGQSPGAWNAGYRLDKLTFSVNQIAKSSQEVAIASHNQAVGGWLIDQQGNPTYYQIWVNKTWYDYVVSNQFYNRDNFTDKTLIKLPDGATEIKSSWRILTAKDDTSKYITQASEIALFDAQGKATGQSDSVTLGLVGLHIVYKVKGYPQWIWATFEHNLNVPDSSYDATQGAVVSKPIAGVNYSYFNDAATAAEVNQAPCGTDGQDCKAFTTPNPLTRITPLRDEAKAANSDAISKAPVQGTVLANYRLITTQWPSQPNNPSVTFGDPIPTVSANTTMESYIQSTSNCMACHGPARLPGLQAKSDFSFLFNYAHSSPSK